MNGPENLKGKLPGKRKFDLGEESKVTFVMRARMVKLGWLGIQFFYSVIKSNNISLCINLFTEFYPSIF